MVFGAAADVRGGAATLPGLALRHAGGAEPRAGGRGGAARRASEPVRRAGAGAVPVVHRLVLHLGYPRGLRHAPPHPLEVKPPPGLASKRGPR